MHLVTVRNRRVPVMVGLLLLTVTGCGNETKTPAGPAQEQAKDAPRHLGLAFIGETAVEIQINGQILSDSIQAERLRVDMDSEGSTYAGKNNNKTVEINPSHTQATTVAPCPGTCEGNVFYDDLWGDVTTASYRGTIADGDYTVKLYVDDNLESSKAIAVNHADGGLGNGTFLDEASDQVITFYLNQSLQEISSPTVSNQHTRASNHLSASIVQPAAADTIIPVGQSLSVAGSAANGVGGTKKYAWEWDASGGSQETFDTEFSTSTTASHTYSTPGTYKIRLIARDGNDDKFSGTRGGHYSVSSVRTVHVVSNAPDAEAAGHTLPGNMDYFTYYATSVSMKNVGGETWSGSNFVLEQSNDVNIWDPQEVGLGSSVVTTGETHVFSFSMASQEPDYCGSRQNYWRMSGSSGFFGDENGRYTTLKNCPSARGFSLERFFAFLSPAAAYASPLRSWVPSDTEVIQVLSRSDYPIPVAKVKEDGEIRFRYLSQLSQVWDVDFSFHVKFDPSVFTVGSLIQGARATGYDVAVRSLGPGEVLLEGTRAGGEGLNGTGTIFELPLRLRPGAAPPETLPLVELIISR